MKILHNAHITTMDAAQPEATALAIDNGVIVAAGSEEDVLALAGPGTQVEDLRGQHILPGLTDAHLHMEHYARFLQMIDCETDTKAECLRRVEARARLTPPGGWILGHGWNQNVWPEGFGNAADLDAVSGGRPVYLTSKSLHSGWANSAALQKAGITATSPDPQGGVIGRDAAGRPNGIVFESAMELLDAVIPNPCEEELCQTILAAQTELWKLGLTGIHDFDYRTCFAALQILAGRDQLRLRTVKSIPLELLEHAVGLGLRSGFGGEFLRIGSVKLFADGALGPRTAAMLAPYENESEYTGIALLDGEQIFEYGQKAVRAGLSMAIHAIGDRANHEVLNGYEQLRAYEDAHGLPHYRHRIEHVQVLHPADLERLSRLNVIASMQPIHATSDMYIADQHWGNRAEYAYAWRALLARGTAMAFGSDAPVESPNPFLGLHAAITRARTDGAPGPDGWRPTQRLSLQEALAGFTTGPAYAAGAEARQGRLSAGAWADLIVLPQDLFALPPIELHTVRPGATMVAGEWVWQA